MHGALPGPGQKIDAEQDYVAGHRIRKNTPMSDVHEAIEKTPCEGQQRADGQRGYPQSRFLEPQRGRHFVILARARLRKR